MKYYLEKLTWKWVLLYVVIGAIVYGLIYYFIFYKMGNYSESYQYPKPTGKQTISNSQNETADWKTYRNDEYEFEFKYPKDWILNNQKVGSRIVSIISPENESLAKKEYEGTYYFIDFAVSVCDKFKDSCPMGGTWVDMKNKSIIDFLNDKSPYKSYQKSSFMSEVIVDGMQGYGIIAGGLGANYEIILEKNSEIYSIDFPSSEKELTLEQKTMLSTFKFTR